MKMSAIYYFNNFIGVKLSPSLEILSNLLLQEMRVNSFILDNFCSCRRRANFICSVTYKNLLPATYSRRSKIMINVHGIIIYIYMNNQIPSILLLYSHPK
jgi:hypothetical protein